MIDEATTTIIVVSVILGVLFIIIIIDTVIQYNFNHKKKIHDEKPQKINETMENMNDN